MKTPRLVKKLKKFSLGENDGMTEEDFEKCLNLIFRYLATLQVDECVDTLSQMIKTGVQLNVIEGRLKEKLKKKKKPFSIFGWTRKFTNSFDVIWQETARIFSPSTYKT